MYVGKNADWSVCWLIPLCILNFLILLKSTIINVLQYLNFSIKKKKKIDLSTLNTLHVA